ncbi:MAG: Ig-like domain-containing protein [Verrucomicrobia bacterium]|nr:Ig-like domain-containing protein [Verrucomicrobiota bacterium]
MKPLSFSIVLLGTLLWNSHSVQGQNIIPPSFKMPAGSVDTTKPGFAISIHQMEAARPSGNSLPDPVRQARGELIDSATGLPVENLVDTLYPEEASKWVPNSSFTAPRIFNEGGVINYNQDTRNDPAATIGRFQADKPIPGIPGITSGTDNIAFEAVTFLQLTAGTHTMVVNSDDGFVVKTGASPLDALGQVLGIFNNGRGSADTAFDIVVQEDGIYPFVLQWWEGGGGANVEWFTVVAGDRILINDTSNPKAVKAYRAASVSRPYVSSVDPAPGAFGVPIKPTIEIKIIDGDAKVSTSTVKLSVNGSAVTSTVNKSGATTTVQYTPAQALPDSSTVSVELTYGDSATPPNLVKNSLSFLTERLANTLPPIRQDTTGLAVIEAENFDASLKPGDHSWLFAKTPRDFTGAGTMYALPDTGAVINLPDALTGSPRLDYKVNFARTGKHYLWMRGSDGGGNSLHAGIDEVDPSGTGLDNIDDPGCCGTRAVGGTSWVWLSGTDGTAAGRSTFEVTTAGVHTLHLWLREDGQIIDKFLVTTDPNFNPTGDGPPESRRVGDKFKPVVTITSPSVGATLPSSSPVAITVNATDEDGTIAKVEFFAGGKKIGESTSAPFGLQWKPDVERNYTLSARRRIIQGRRTCRFRWTSCSGGLRTWSILPPARIQMQAIRSWSITSRISLAFKSRSLMTMPPCLRTLPGRTCLSFPRRSGRATSAANSPNRRCPS